MICSGVGFANWLNDLRKKLFDIQPPQKITAKKEITEANKPSFGLNMGKVNDNNTLAILFYVASGRSLIHLLFMFHFIYVMAYVLVMKGNITLMNIVS